MFKIKYCNGYSDRQVTFVAPFKRLNYCNAAYYHIETNDGKYTIHKYALVSYETPICRIVQFVNNETGKDRFNIFINRDSYRCSNSTIHQLVRFLRIAMGDLFTYKEIKYYENHCPYPNNCYISSYAPMHLTFLDGDTLKDTILADNKGISRYWSGSVC